MMLFIFVFVIVFVVVLIAQFIGSSPSDTLQEGRQKYFYVSNNYGIINVYPLDKYPGECFDFYIAGINYSHYAESHLGEFVGELKAEPRNEYDRNAIKIVDLDGHKLGYVPKELTAKVRSFRTLPCTCFCYIARYDGKYITRCYINTPGIHNMVKDFKD